MAYCYKASSGCLIICYSQPLAFGQPVVVPGIPPGTFGQKYFYEHIDKSFGVDPACGGTSMTKGTPDKTTEPSKGKVPTPTPPGGCDPALEDDPKPVPIPSGPITGQGGSFGGFGIGSGGGWGSDGPGSRSGPDTWRRGSKYKWTQEEALKMPVVAGLTPINVYSSWNGVPSVTQAGHLKKVDGKIKEYHETTGAGLLVLHSPELQDWMLPGPGVLPSSAWVKDLSPAVLHFLSVARNESGEGSARSHLQFGTLVEGQQTPGFGWRLVHDPVNNELEFLSYAADGTLDASHDFKINGVVVPQTIPDPPDPPDPTPPFGSTQLELSEGPGMHQVDIGIADVVIMTDGDNGLKGIENGMPIIKIENVSAFNVTLKNEDGTADAPTRIVTGTGFDYTLAPNTGVVVSYVSNRWRVNCT